MYSAAVGVYLAPAAVLALVALAVVPGLSLRARVLLPAVALAAGALAILPELSRTLRLGRAAAAAAGDPAAFVGDRGNLPGPVDKLTVLGAWIGPDYRVPYIYIRPTHAAMVAAAVLAGAAVLVALRRRRLALPAILVAVAAGAVYVAASSSIYYTAKTYQVAAFPIACAVVAGAAALTRCPWRPQLAVPVAAAGALLLGGYAAAMELGIGQAARAAAVTPPEFRQLQALARDAPHDLGLALVHDDWTKVLLPDAAVPYDGSFGANVRAGYGFAGIIDMDSIEPGALRGVHWIVEPRLGGTSFPPAPFRPARGSAAYRLWSRATGSAARTNGTLPLERHDTLGGLTLAPGSIGRRPAKRPAGGSRRRRHALLPGAVAAARLGLGTMGRQPRLRRSVSGWRTVRHARRSRSESAGLYEVSLIGQPTFHMRIRIDGKDLPAPDLSSPGVSRRSRRSHTPRARPPLARPRRGRSRGDRLHPRDLRGAGREACAGRRLRRRPARPARGGPCGARCNGASESRPAAAARRCSTASTNSAPSRLTTRAHPPPLARLSAGRRRIRDRDLRVLGAPRARAATTSASSRRPATTPRRSASPDGRRCASGEEWREGVRVRRHRADPRLAPQAAPRAGARPSASALPGNGALRTAVRRPARARACCATPRASRPT